MSLDAVNGNIFGLVRLPFAIKVSHFWNNFSARTGTRTREMTLLSQLEMNEANSILKVAEKIQGHSILSCR